MHDPSHSEPSPAEDAVPPVEPSPGEEMVPLAEPSPLEETVRAEIVEAERPDRPIRRWLRSVREYIEAHPRLKVFYRIGVAIFGGALALGGLVLVPLPGPGWLVVFLGLAVLGTEFHWARRISAWLKHMLDRFWAWWRARRARKAADRAARTAE